VAGKTPCISADPNVLSYSSKLSLDNAVSLLYQNNLIDLAAKSLDSMHGIKF
jgi:hypothetical protein